MKSWQENGQMLQLFTNGRLFLLTWQSILYQYARKILYQHIHIHICVHTTCLDQQQQNHALLLLLHTSAVSWLSFPGTAMDVIEVFKTVVEHESSVPDTYGFKNKY